eukprot:80794_1
MLNLKFGISVLEWFKYDEPGPRFKNFHDEIINNEESTVNEQLYLNFSQECIIKMNSRKWEQYTLEELLSLKIYTDSNTYQSVLRKSLWTSRHQDKKSFYFGHYNYAKQHYFTIDLFPLGTTIEDSIKIISWFESCFCGG